MNYGDFELEDGAYELKHGAVLQVFTKDGYQWACLNPEHGPDCKRGQRLSNKFTAAAISNVLDGKMDLRDHPEKGLQFRVTDDGEDQVRTILAQFGLTPEEFLKMPREKVLQFLGLDSEKGIRDFFDVS